MGNMTGAIAMFIAAAAFGTVAIVVGDTPLEQVIALGFSFATAVAVAAGIVILVKG